MDEYLTYRDLPLLHAAGFHHGMTMFVLWGKDITGQEWQAVEEAYRLTLARRMPDGRTESHMPMKRSEFEKLFLGEDCAQ